MPMKWTLENDHLLLLKVLETNPGLSVDGKKIAAAWPKDRGEIPTPRAITEHIFTIRKKSDAGTGSKTSTPRGRKSGQTPSTTPTKRRRRGTANPKASATTPTKSVKFEDLDSDEVDGIIDNVLSQKNEASSDEDEDAESASPSKKSRINRAGSTILTRYEDEDEEVEVEVEEDESDELVEGVNRGTVTRLSSIVV
ncbi:MAG: hypothetical protein M1813_008726 [Trichoglossum hirsutum]|nr:MAG: hypothetical protein M1813_008726 [Trichoglossum hirsutum]